MVTLETTLGFIYILSIPQENTFFLYFYTFVIKNTVSQKKLTITRVLTTKFKIVLPTA